jgi:2-amino-4-hydroxy-6-hydroxymethyldihydropteridine diphosphokinase
VSATAYLGLGSNLGERLGSLQDAVDRLDREPGLNIVASSRVWETDPVGGPDQPDYLNAVVRAQTDLTPFELLEVCHQVETALGRTREVRWGPRTIDIDLLTFDQQRIDVPFLTLPHPRMNRRAFVVLPLLELDPAMRLPDGSRLIDLRVPNVATGARPYASPLVLT